MGKMKQIMHWLFVNMEYKGTSYIDFDRNTKKEMNMRKIPEESSGLADAEGKANDMLDGTSWW